mmetsp:Transcript_26342/g.40257  ORF Transcript_26342/g.40257 Transcript_26342/m.40257 type:complete len:591 (+) Transcript_26342:124-1896(+)
MSAVFDVPEEGAWAVLGTVLVIFSILAVVSAGYGSSILPAGVTDLLVAKNLSEGGESEGKSTTVNDGSGLLATDFFLSARASTGTFGIAMSFFASGMGAWVVYGSTEMGALPQLSWLGILGYSIASSIPGVFVMWLGPLIKKMTEGERAFSTTDFCRVRYGRVMQLSCAAISVFYMWIYLVAEFTSISNVYALLVNRETVDYVTDPDQATQVNVWYTSWVAISIGSATLLYTAVAGLPSSIVTDKFQGIMMAGLVLLLTIVVLAVKENRISSAEFALASNWTADGFYAMVTLIIAIICAELFNQATWQRVWAAKDNTAMRRGFGLGSALVFLLMMFFGIMGMIGYANDPESYDTAAKYAYLAFFDLLLPLNQGWHVMVLIFVTALAASSIDSLQNGITCMLSADFITFLASPSIIKWLNRGVLLAVNIAAIVKSGQRLNVLGLFLVADLVCATAVFPVFLGLIPTDGKFKFLSPTELGAFLGCIGGIATVLIIGCVYDYETFGKKPFEFFWLEVDAQCALCGTTKMWTFIITPIGSMLVTIIVTTADIMIRGEEKARKPLFTFAFDKKEGDEEVEEKASNDKIFEDDHSA